MEITTLVSLDRPLKVTRKKVPLPKGQDDPAATCWGVMAYEEVDGKVYPRVTAHVLGLDASAVSLSLLTALADRYGCHDGGGG